MSKFPFSQAVNNDVIRRVFSSAVDDEELVWHRDARDRHISVLESKGWYLQFDNQLPVELAEGSRHFIPKGLWHRVFKKKVCGDLVVEIKELTE